MNFWIGLIGGMIIGIIIGYSISLWLRTKGLIGTLRVDHSDPDEAPYLFLELSNGGFDKIQQGKIVSFVVKMEDYIPRN